MIIFVEGRLNWMADFVCNKKKVNKMDLKNLIIFGAGEGSEELLKILIEDINASLPTWKVLGFKDKNTKNDSSELFGYPVLKNEYDKISGEIYGICSVMENKIRHKIIKEEIINKGYILTSLIHPSANLA